MSKDSAHAEDLKRAKREALEQEMTWCVLPLLLSPSPPPSPRRIEADEILMTWVLQG